MGAMDYVLRVQITTPDTILDTTIDLGQWVADRNANVTAMAGPAASR